MFDHISLPANPVEVSKWLKYSSLMLGGNVAASIALLIGRIRELIPADLINEKYFYSALLFSIIAALPLYVFPIVLNVGLSQMGIATAALYIAFALTPHFLPENRFEITMVLGAVAVAVQIPFLIGYRHLVTNRAWSDFALSIFMSVCFIGVWVYPFFALWR